MVFSEFEYSRFVNDENKYLIEKSDNLIIGYTYPKNTTNVYGFKTNQLGFVDQEHNIESSSDYRILVIGDSVTAGLSFKSYAYFLEEELNKESNFTYEVIIMAVEGYNTIQELEILEEWGLKFNPDIVILQFTYNDLEDFHIKQALSRFKIKIRNFKIWLKYDYCPDIDSGFIYDFNQEKFKLDCYLKRLNLYLEEFKDLSESYSFKPILLIHSYNNYNLNYISDLMYNISVKNDVDAITTINFMKPDFFSDTIHLNEKGNIELSKLLKVKINSIINNN